MTEAMPLLQYATTLGSVHKDKGENDTLARTRGYIDTHSKQSLTIDDAFWLCVTLAHVISWCNLF